MNNRTSPDGAGSSAGDRRDLELYTLAVEMADRVSARRGASNSFFVAVQTAFIAVAGLTAPLLHRSPWISLVIPVAGVLLSASWWLQLRSYRDLNRAKFEVISRMESTLPCQIYSDEWKYLGENAVRRGRGRYSELGAVERVVPWVFAALYVVIAMEGIGARPLG